MNEKIRSIFNSKKDKVSSAKQQLLSIFSSNHAPIQYGVDYSPKDKQGKTNNSSRQQLETKRLGFSKKPFLSTDNESKETLKSRRNIDNGKLSTFETVSSINFQKSPPVRRKVIQISSNHKTNRLPGLDSKDHTESFVTKEGPHNINVSSFSNSIEKPLQIRTPSKTNVDKCNLSSKSAEKKLPKQISTVKISDNCKDNIISVDKKPILKKSSTIIEPKSTMKSDFIDPSLVSVAQRAKYIMKTNPNRSISRNVTQTSVKIKPEDEENEEPILSIKDRINIFKDNIHQTTALPRTENSGRRNPNRFKTQPLSFDDIARANEMILGQTEVTSTIDSPSLTNSSETLIDISEESNSSITNVQHPLKSVARVKSCLINQKPNFQKLIDEEEMITSISVKDLVKNHYKEPEVAVSPKLSRNPAVSRRLAFKSRAVTEDKINIPNKTYAKRIHLTQPITKEDIESSNMNRNDSNKSINDRINSIQENENKWKQRVIKSPDELNATRPGSVYEIQDKLHINQANWKSRIEQKDVEQFTTAGKLLSIKNTGITMRHSFHGSAFKEENPQDILVTRLTKLNSTDQKPAKIKLISNLSLASEDNAVIENKKVEIKDTLLENNTLLNKTLPQQAGHSHKVVVPKSDQNLSNFFKTSESFPNNEHPDNSKHTSDDFDEIFLESDLNLTIAKRSVKPVRKQRTTSKNPLKSLNNRPNIVEEYEEISYGIGESEMKRCQVENLQHKAGYAEEALAGLSSKEDFSKVKLKRTESGKIFEHFVSPYKNLMLISVKGRKKVQLRLVEPVASSINCGDCYLLVTGSRIFVWQGICANVIEMNKANELGSWIAKCKDLNYKGNEDKPTIVKSNDSATNANVVQFWSCLNYDQVPQYNNPGVADEDDLYEQRIQTTNMVYKVVGNELIPLDEYWGRSLKYQILSDNQVYIFDFGCELYLWSGNKAENLTRMHGRALLRQLWSLGFNYEECSINPLDPLPESSKEAKPKKGSVRPDWVIVGRLPQRGETILFKEKFIDWPESSRLIRMDNNLLTSTEKKSLNCDLQPVDLDDVLKIVHPSVHLIIDGKSVGRGGNWTIIEDGIQREFNVSTSKVEVWHITDNNAVAVNEKSMGQFCNGDAYIIKWDYELKTMGRFKRNQSTGNLSSVFFFWQGANTTVTEKTASALHTIDLDKDKVTQIRVKQHDESPAFCRLFDGTMIIHNGKRKVVNQKLSIVRLFIIRGEIEGESHLIEVKCEPESLKARSTFLLLNTHSGNGYLWFGRLSSSQSRLCSHYCINSINKRKPLELGLNSKVDIRIQEIIQGDENRTFWQEFGAVKRWRSWNSAVSLEPIRAWLVSAVSNSFDLIELKYSLNPDLGNNIIPTFPLIQSSLYKANQPALFIIWTRSHVYLWQGWWPQLTKSTSSDSDADLEEEEIDHDWSIPKNRIAAEKLAALKTLSSYLQKYESVGLSASIIYAGLEPQPFLELFPAWEVNETAKLANIKKGYQLSQEDDISQTLNKYLTEKFSVSRLQRQPLPECVILSKIEWYLSDQDFENLFKMSKEEFYEMTQWKQREKKKEVNLF